MNWFNNGVAFAIIYMVVLFCVLPFGVRTHQEEGTPMEPGQATSAPVNPRIGLKFLITLGITCVLFSLYYVVGYFDLLGFGDLVGR